MNPRVDDTLQSAEDRSCPGPETGADQDALGSGDPVVAFWEIAPALEIICWVVVGLAPMLYVVNGPPVTHDQAIIQVTLVTLAALGSLFLRAYNWRHRDRWRALLAPTESDEAVP